MSEQITVRVPKEELDQLEAAISAGRFATRAEAVREALRLLFRKERNQTIAESYRRAYHAEPQETWIGEAGAASMEEVIARKGARVSTVRTCECGCGGTPRAGHFLPGHDAKLMSRLRRAAKAGDEEAEKELVRRGWR